MQRKKGKRGFTLIELIVVVAILALLAAIALPKFMKSRKTASEAAHLANVRVLRAAATTYLANADGDVNAAWTKDSKDAWKDYIETWPDCPLDTHDAYVVNIDENGTIDIVPDESQVSSAHKESSAD